MSVDGTGAGAGKGALLIGLTAAISIMCLLLGCWRPAEGSEVLKTADPYLSASTDEVDCLTVSGQSRCNVHSVTLPKGSSHDHST